MKKVLVPDVWIEGGNVSLRLVTLKDCTPIYVNWLCDREVNAFLETRWTEQTMDSVREFVRRSMTAEDIYLLGIIENCSGQHIGNIKLGPIHPIHSHADVSYFIGEKRCWGRGYATQAISLVTAFGFERLELHRLQAGVYATNIGSIRALKKVGYVLEACFRQQLRLNGKWEDHLFYGLLRDSWTARRA